MSKNILVKNCIKSIFYLNENLNDSKNKELLQYLNLSSYDISVLKKIFLNIETSNVQVKKQLSRFSKIWSKRQYAKKKKIAQCSYCNQMTFGTHTDLKGNICHQKCLSNDLNNLKQKQSSTIETQQRKRKRNTTNNNNSNNNRNIVSNSNNSNNNKNIVNNSNNYGIIRNLTTSFINQNRNLATPFINQHKILTTSVTNQNRNLTTPFINQNRNLTTPIINKNRNIISNSNNNGIVRNLSTPFINQNRSIVNNSNNNDIVRNLTTSFILQSNINNCDNEENTELIVQCGKCNEIIVDGNVQTYKGINYHWYCKDYVKNIIENKKKLCAGCKKDVKLVSTLNCIGKCKCCLLCKRHNISCMNCKNETCRICLDLFHNRDKFIVTSCNHKYHIQCIKRCKPILNKKIVKCPLCMTKCCVKCYQDPYIYNTKCDHKKRKRKRRE
jgi:hypothetical protein